MSTPHRLRPQVLAVVALGGAVGSLLRYALSIGFPDTSGGFPWTVFSINVAGCAVLAALPASAAVRRHPLLPPLLGTGVLGGFTTLSTYGEQARALAEGGHDTLAAAYVLGTLATCLLAVLIVGRLTSAASRDEFRDEEGDR